MLPEGQQAGTAPAREAAPNAAPPAKSRVRAEGLGHLAHLADETQHRQAVDETGAPPGEAALPPAKNKRAAVWKSSGPAAAPAVQASAGLGTLTPADLAALQAMLNKSITSSVRESLQSSMHAELSEVKRALKSAEEVAAVRRKQDEVKHQALLLQLESASEAVQESQGSAATIAAQAQASAEERAREAEARAQVAAAEARDALLAETRADASKREMEAELARATAEFGVQAQHLRDEQQSALKHAADDADRRVAEAQEAAQTKLQEAAAAADQRVALLEKQILESEQDNDSWAEATLSRQVVDVDAITRELRSAEAVMDQMEARLADTVAAERAEVDANEKRDLESRVAELQAANEALDVQRHSMEDELAASRQELEQLKLKAQEELAATREALHADAEAMRADISRAVASEAMQREVTSLLEQREQLARERLQLDAAALTMSRETAAARAELSQLEESTRVARDGLMEDRRAMQAERAAVQALLENDRTAYAEALQRERESAASTAAAVEQSHAAVAASLRQQLADASAQLEAATLVKADAVRARLAAEQSVHAVQRDLDVANDALAAVRLELVDVRASMDSAEAARERAVEEADSLRRQGDRHVHAVSASFSREVRALEGEARRAKESEATARTAQAHSETVMQRTFEQLGAESAAAKGIADERIRVVEEEAAWTRETLERQLREARDALSVASAGLVAEQSSVAALRSMLLVADADVAAMRGAAAHYATLGGEEAGALREAVSRAEVAKRDAVEAERRRCDQLLERERSHFDSTLARLRESSFAAQAKLQSQLSWVSDALEERTRQLHSEREAFDVALAKEREATAAAHDSSRRVLQEVADRQAARHAAELAEQGQAMEAQLAVEREAFLEQLVDHRGLHEQLADARAEARAAKLELAEVRNRYNEERQQWMQEASEAREGWRAERAELEAERHEAVKEVEARLMAAHESEASTAARTIHDLGSQLAGLAEASEREREMHQTEAKRLQAYVNDIEQRATQSRIAEVYRSTEELEEELAEAERLKQSLEGRVRALMSAAQAEIERGTAQVAEMQQSRSAQLQLESSQLAELHAQSAAALKAMTEGREALAREAEAHRRTQEQLLALHETMQKERDAFAQEVAGDRDARAQLPVVMAQLASARKIIENGSSSNANDSARMTATAARATPSSRASRTAKFGSTTVAPTQPEYW
jgi:hypothetical protein